MNGNVSVFHLGLLHTLAHPLHQIEDVSIQAKYCLFFSVFVQTKPAPICRYVNYGTITTCLNNPTIPQNEGAVFASAEQRGVEYVKK